ncbi:hypothetical protein U1Q18_002556 [Sarracenia purpurea var. burkii]
MKKKGEYGGFNLTPTNHRHDFGIFAGHERKQGFHSPSSPQGDEPQRAPIWWASRSSDQKRSPTPGQEKHPVGCARQDPQSPRFASMSNED